MSAPTRLLVEQRFPLCLSPQIAAIRSLYNEAKAARWNPVRDLAWADLRADGLAPELCDAVRRCWSRRAWVEATALTETPALLIRFCMETGRESDPKFFLAVRNTEEAWHIECFDRVAEIFGGRVERPDQPAYEAVFNQGLYRRALDADQMLDSHVAVHAAFEDGLELELCRGWRAATTHPVLAAMLDRVIAARQRHAAFGWLYLQARAARWSAAERAAIADAIVRHVQQVELAGYHCPWLAPEHAAAEVAADRLTAAAGLGGATPEAEAAILAAYVADARARLRELGVTLPRFETNRLRTF